MVLVTVEEIPVQTTPLIPATPAEEEQTELVTAGQRRVNLIWECTQGLTAIMLTSAFIYCQVHQVPAELLNAAFFMIATFYFARTNHVKLGGVSPFSRSS